MAAGPDAPAPLPRPRLIGRLVRFVLGAILLYFFVNILVVIPWQARDFLARQTGWRVPGGAWWIAAILCFLALPTIINSGFSRDWDGWPQVAFLVLAGGAIAWDWLAYGALWAWPLALLVLMLVTYVFAHAGVSYLVAAFAATPG
jgi:small-conductance mechanosensitive channel